MASENSGPFQWVGGLFFSKLESVFDDINQAPGFAPASVGGAAANPAGIVYDTNNPYHVTQYAVFGQGTYQFTDAWSLTAGLRYFRYSTHVDEQQEGSLTATGNATHRRMRNSIRRPPASRRRSTSPGSPDKNLTVYTSASEGFRPGGANLPLPSFCQATTETYGPDSAWDYELGEKARLFGNRVSVNSDIFYIQWKKRAAIDQSGLRLLTHRRCRRRSVVWNGDGVDGSFDVEPETDGQRRLYRCPPDLDQSGRCAGLIDAALLPARRFSTSRNTRKARRSAIRTRSTTATTFVARATNSYVGPSTDTSFSYTNLQPYDLVSIRGGVEADAWSAYFFVNNLTNKIAELSTNTTSFLVDSCRRSPVSRPISRGHSVSMSAITFRPVCNISAE